jgi:hypothetical protein
MLLICTSRAVLVRAPRSTCRIVMAQVQHHNHRFHARPSPGNQSRILSVHYQPCSLAVLLFDRCSFHISAVGALCTFALPRHCASYTRGLMLRTTEALVTLFARQG